ncbi:hypothetical protein GCM10023084_49110 [Streptomyces lacrimifluminis]|uniref:Uncharacterized protein n=1 Tax=Streptomyces lacrimifluminis TaxID=1500077 RepID=A0A917L945_9ACTN|nr:hypothetical protein GCM10012282_52510 [Streptomyces lacrimifluminis]
MGEDCARLTAPDGGRDSAGWFTWRLLKEGVGEGAAVGDPGAALSGRFGTGGGTPTAVGCPGVGCVVE